MPLKVTLRITLTLNATERRKYFNQYVKKGKFEDWMATMKKNQAGRDLNFEVHHVIPINILEKNKDLQDLLMWAKKNKKGFDFNGNSNAIPLQKKKNKIDLNGHGNHPEYDKVMKKKIDDILGNPGTNADKLNEIKKLVDNTKKVLEDNVLLGKMSVNDKILPL